MTRRDAALVVGLVSGSHVVNHAYLLLFAPAFPLLREEFGVSLGALGLALGVVNLVVTLGQLPLGHVSDSYSHGSVLVGSLAVGSLGAAAAALAPTYEGLLLAAALMGLGVAGHHPAHYPLISAATPEAYRSRAYSAHGFAGAVGLSLPFAAVPAAVALGFDWRTAFGAIAALGLAYAVVTALALRGVPRSIVRAGALARAADRDEVDDADEGDSADRIDGPPAGDPRSPGTLTDRGRRQAARIGRYARTLAEAPLVLLLVVLWFVNSVAVWGVRTYAATLLDAGYGLAAGPANLAASAMLVVGAVVLLGGGYLADRIGPMPLLYAGYGSLVVLAAVLSTVRVPAAAAVALVLLLAATVDLSRPARATMTDLASARRDVGKNFAVVTLGISLGGAVAPPLFGAVIEGAGVGVAFLGIAATAAVAVAISVAIAGHDGAASGDPSEA